MFRAVAGAAAVFCSDTYACGIFQQTPFDLVTILSILLLTDNTVSQIRIRVRKVDRDRRRCLPACRSSSVFTIRFLRNAAALAAEQTPARSGSRCRTNHPEENHAVSFPGPRQATPLARRCSSALRGCSTNRIAPLLDVTEEHVQTGKQQDKRSKPEQISRGRDARSIQDEVAVALREKGDDLLIAFAGFHLHAYFAAQVFGQGRQANQQAFGFGIAGNEAR